MRNETVLGLCMCVCVCVCYHYSATTRNVAAKEQYQQPQCNVAMDKKAIFLKVYFVQKLWLETRAKKPIANEFELTVNVFRALPRSTQEGNHLMDNK